MKSFCTNCSSLEVFSFRQAADVVTGEPYEDLCCDVCHSVVVSVQGREDDIEQVAWMSVENGDVSKALLYFNLDEKIHPLGVIGKVTTRAEVISKRSN